MAKLNVEVTKELFGLETEVTYKGSKYERTIGEAPRKGDIIKVVNGWGSIKAGDFYEDIREEHRLYSLAPDANDQFTFIKGEPGDASTTLDNVIVFRKVDEQQSPIEPGTKIKIVNPQMAVGYGKGDVLTVTRHVEEGYGASEHVFTEEAGIAVLRSEFEVVEGGSKDVQPGSRIRIIDAFSPLGTYRNGDVFTVESVSNRTKLVVTVEEHDTIIFGYEFEVVEENPDPTFKKGDKVRLLSGGGDFPLHGFRTGSEYTIKAMPEDHSAHPGKGLIRITNDRSVMHGYASPDQLELVEEESDQSTLATEVSDGIKAGDIVRINQPGHSNHGKIMRVSQEGTGYSDFPHRTETLKGERKDIHSADQLEKVTTTKRPAKVGELIVITNAEAINEQTYGNGDVLTVEEASVLCEGDVYVEGFDTYVDGKEYEVIEGSKSEDHEEVVAAEATPKVEIEHGDIVIGKRADVTLVGEVEDIGDYSYGVRALFLAKGRVLNEYRAFDVSGGDTVTLIAKKADRKDLEG